MNISSINNGFVQTNYVKKLPNVSNELNSDDFNNNNYDTYANSYNTAFMAKKYVMPKNITELLDRKVKAAIRAFKATNNSVPHKVTPKPIVKKGVAKPINAITTEEGITHTIELGIIKPDELKKQINVKINSTNINNELIASTDLSYRPDGLLTSIDCKSADGKTEFIFKRNGHINSRRAMFAGDEKTIFRPTQGRGSHFYEADLGIMEQNIATIGGSDLAKTFIRAIKN